eukprot:scaffold2808_cov255-Pinguiococcus_pyrenoidosus.AAC.5
MPQRLSNDALVRSVQIVEHCSAVIHRDEVPVSRDLHNNALDPNELGLLFGVDQHRLEDLGMHESILAAAGHLLGVATS